MSFRANRINRNEEYELSERKGESETMLEHFRTQNLTDNDYLLFPATEDTPKYLKVERKKGKLEKASREK